ncbi:hypothetical protein GE21DRAFT_1287074 [Neurospora crassa]|nr:hypothetical protein GE21DRAFT_1287074 [Neurospora crassa]
MAVVPSFSLTIRPRFRASLEAPLRPGPEAAGIPFRAARVDLEVQRTGCSCQSYFMDSTSVLKDLEEVAWQFRTVKRATVTRIWQWFFSSRDSGWDRVSYCHGGVCRGFGRRASMSCPVLGSPSQM